MKKLIAIASIAALFSAFAAPTFAAGKSAEEICKARAEHKKVAADKMDAFVKTCVEQRMKKHHVAKKDPAPAAAPAATPAPAAPAESPEAGQ